MMSQGQKYMLAGGLTEMNVNAFGSVNIETGNRFISI